MIPLVAPCITETDRAYLHRRIEEGLLTNDSEVGLFERNFADFVGVREAVAVNSGTTALHLALSAVGVEPGDRVLLPSYTCVALLHAVHACGAVPVLLDNACEVRNANFHVLPEEIQRKMALQPRALLLSHTFGTLFPLSQYAFDLPVIEDFTLSLGACLDGRRSGSMGTVGIASLHRSKMLSSDQGGIVVSSDPAIMQRIRQQAHYDAPMADWRTASDGSLRGHYAPAMSCAMSAMQAALGNSQLSQLEAFLARRQEIAARYTERFEQAGILCPEIPAPQDRNAFFRYIVRCERPVVPTLERLRCAGIQAGRGVYPPLHCLLDLPDRDFPGAVECIRNLLSVPLHPSLTDSQADAVSGEVVEALKA